MVSASIIKYDPKLDRQLALFNKIEFNPNRDIILGCAPAKVVDQFSSFCEDHESFTSLVNGLLENAGGLKKKRKARRRGTLEEMGVNPPKDENRDKVMLLVWELCVFAESRGRC